jgi:parvulin-like peptidyl-prolyl isomerase
MPKTPSQRGPRAAFVVVGGATMTVLLSGCASSQSRANEQQILKSAGLAPGERSPGARDGEERSLAARPITDEAPADVQVLVGPPEGAAEASVGAPGVEGDPGAGFESAPAPLEVVDRAPPPMPRSLADSGFVDAVVGQINGRPVFASEFLAPMDARLRAEASRLPPNQWRQTAIQTIGRAVVDRMNEELVLAEFQAQLTPESRQGLFAFVERMRQEIVAENLGSESLAGRRLQESEGLTLDEKVKQQRDREIIRAQLGRAIRDRVYVSWREVELAYERDYDLYNPAPVARLRMIQASDPEKAASIREALAAGRPFEEIAREFSDFRAEEGGLWTIEVEREGYANTRIFAPEELNSVASALEPGEVSDEFEWSGSRVWLSLEAIETPPGKSLYEAQHEIYRRLQQQRVGEEELAYLERIRGRGSMTDVETMVFRLLEIAEERYISGPQAGGGS